MLLSVLQCRTALAFVSILSKVWNQAASIRQYAMMGLNFSSSPARFAKGAILGLRSFAGRVADIVIDRKVRERR